MYLRVSRDRERLKALMVMTLVPVRKDCRKGREATVAIVSCVVRMKWDQVPEAVVRIESDAAARSETGAMEEQGRRRMMEGHFKFSY